jgi:hypothetical protein
MKRTTIVVSIILVALAGVCWWIFSGDETENSTATLNSATAKMADLNSGQSPSSATIPGVDQSGQPTMPEGPKSREQLLAEANSRYELTSSIFESYRDFTRYPHDSRPLEEAADQIYPFEPFVEELPLRNERGEPVGKIILKTSQDRIFFSGADRAKFTVQALDSNGKVIPLQVTRAIAQLTVEGNQPQQFRAINLDFSDAGPGDSRGADQVAGDGQLSAQLSPQTQGWAGGSGGIKVQLNLRVGNEQGQASFDLTYTDEIPATWGGIREKQEAGSLNFYVKANIQKPGRFVVSSRVDDANGQPFALLRFNKELASGEQEIKLHVFGALIRDKRPKFPLKLRDMDGFLLQDQYPDRLMMARRAGVIYTSANYSIDSFSANEWSSEERDRYLTEYGRDLDAARRELDRLNGK